MSEPQQQSNQLWGIYYTDREYAGEMGDPMRTVVEAPTKQAAEEAAVRLGFDAPWAHPVHSEQIDEAQWLPARRLTLRRKLAQKRSRSIGV